MNSRWKYRKRNQNDINQYFSKVRSFIDDFLKLSKETSEYSKRLEELATDPQFDQLANEAARKIITFQANTNARTWIEAARKTSRGSIIYRNLVSELKRKDAFNNLIAQSAYYIKTLPLSISDRIVKRVAKLSMEGLRPESIADKIKQYIPEASKASAQLIARTQVAKTYAAINQVRAESLGVRAYIWHTVGGPLVRDSHRHMDNVIVFYDDPPAPEVLIGKKSAGNYHAGGIYNCRCYMEPILSIDDITWPHKVYYKGSITRLSRKSFTKLLK